MTLLLAAVIFWFSSQTGEESADTSGHIVEHVLKILVPDYESVSEEAQRGLADRVSFFVRKTAHFSIYGALGFFIYLLMREYRPGCLYLRAVFGGVCYAAADELHQLAVSGRSGMWQDVALDGCGVMAGAGAAYICAELIWRALRKGEKKRRKSGNEVSQCRKIRIKGE